MLVRARLLGLVVVLRLAWCWDETRRPYEAIDPVVGDRLAQMVGFGNLSALAGPLDFATSGEVMLILSGNLMLLEALAPHLTWLRRGPLFVDDATAGSAKLGASRVPGASFGSTTMYKLRHDAEQFEYLAAQGFRSEWLSSVVVPAYREVLRRVEGRVIAQKSVYAMRGHAGERTALLNGCSRRGVDTRERGGGDPGTRRPQVLRLRTIGHLPHRVDVQPSHLLRGVSHDARRSPPGARARNGDGLGQRGRPLRGGRRCERRPRRQRAERCRARGRGRQRTRMWV